MWTCHHIRSITITPEYYPSSCFQLSHIELTDGFCRSLLWNIKSNILPWFSVRLASRLLADCAIELQRHFNTLCCIKILKLLNHKDYQLTWFFTVHLTVYMTYTPYIIISIYLLPEAICSATKQKYSESYLICWLASECKESSSE